MSVGRRAPYVIVLCSLSVSGCYFGGGWNQPSYPESIAIESEEITGAWCGANDANLTLAEDGTFAASDLYASYQFTEASENGGWLDGETRSGSGQWNVSHPQANTADITALTLSFEDGAVAAFQVGLAQDELVVWSDINGDGEYSSLRRC